MRVLHVFKTYYPDSFGGIEQVIFQLCSNMSRRGIQSDVLTLGCNHEQDALEVDNHRVYRAKRDFEIASTGFSISAIRQLAERAAYADIVHYHFPWPFMDIAHFVAKVKKPTVVTYHSDILRQKFLYKMYYPLMHLFLADVHRIVATSPMYLATSQVLTHYRDKVDVIPIGLDKRSYPVPSAACRAVWRQRVGERFFLFVGAMRYYKGLHVLLEAVKGTEFPVAIVGAGPLEKGIRAHARQLGLGNVMFLGPLSDKDKVALLQLCYAIAFPSHLRTEAFGVSLLEGAMYGKPMISCQLGTGTSYVNIDGKTGLVVPPGDPAAFRGAMRHLWENPVVAKSMGKQAEIRYRDKFTADKMVDDYISLYQKLIDSARIRGD